MNARIFTNIFYDSPCEEMKTWFDAHKDTHYLINGGGGLRHSTDPWIQKNVHFEDGDNISFLNDKLNEMTVFYYMWKNIKKNDSDFIGYNHYRRVFDLSRYNDKIWNYDIIVSKGLPMVFLKDGKIVQGTVREGYDICHNIQDFLKLEEKIQLRGLSAEWKEWSDLHALFAPCNMFIMKQDLFDEYCSFAFPIIFELEKEIDLAGRDNYQKRALAFLSERLFSFWVFTRIEQNKIAQIYTVYHPEWKPTTSTDKRGVYS